MVGLLVTYDTAALKQALGRYQRALQQYSDVECLRVAEDSLDRIKSGAYWTNRTNKTAKSFGSKPKKAGIAHYVVASSNLVAHFLNVGTRPHTISVGGTQAGGSIRITANRGGSKSARYLRFSAGGSIRYRKSVRHKGTKAIGYDAKEEAVSQPALAEAAERAARRAAELSGL